MIHKSKQGRADINFYNCDNITFMKSKPDNFYKLAIVDPPYGISINMNMGLKKGQKKRHTQKKWDNNAPTPEYFKELARVSENRIIWGGNYFALPSNKHFIVWYKLIPDGMSFSNIEYAWTSFDKANKLIQLRNATGGKIHPTQKPMELYKFLIDKYAKQGDNIYDSHGGSASIALACWDLGFDLDLCELDEDYFNDSWKRFETHSRQQQLF